MRVFSSARAFAATSQEKKKGNTQTRDRSLATRCLQEIAGVWSSESADGAMFFLLSDSTQRHKHERT